MAGRDEFEREPEQADAFQPPPGELLSGARRNRGWSRERVAQELNLDLATVAALEEDRFEALGAPVFARGHLRKYALIMGLDAAAVLSSYEAMAAEQPAPSGSPAPQLDDASSGRGGGLLRLLVVFLVIGAVGVLIWRLASNGDPAPQAGRSTVGIDLEDEQAGEDAEPGLSPMPPPADAFDKTAAPDALTAPDEDTGPPPEPPSRPGGGPGTESGTESGAAAGPAPVADALTQDAGTPDAGGEVSGTADAGSAAPPPDQVLVEMVFSADSWVEVRDPRGQRLIYQLGRQGDRRRIVGEPPLRVFLGFVEGVSIVVDGEAFEVPAERRLGNTARFTIPLDAANAASRR